jgi:hypothetical protein
MSEHTLAVSDSSFEADVLKASGLVLVDFWAEWCGPCKMIGPALEEIGRDLKGKVTVAKVNIDENPVTPPTPMACAVFRRSCWCAMARLWTRKWALCPRASSARGWNPRPEHTAWPRHKAWQNGAAQRNAGAWTRIPVGSHHSAGTGFTMSWITEYVRPQTSRPSAA